MKSKVYFIATKETDSRQTMQSKLARLLEQGELLNCLENDDRVAVKIHFGEEGNTGFVRPEYLRVVIQALVRRNARGFVSDTNTLYRGRRTNSADHLKLAYEHGFQPDFLGMPVIIPDDTKSENVSSVSINQRFVKKARVAKLFLDADALVGVAHFKGHLMTGFGGALKNIGMGCATREGKLEQHGGVSPLIYAEKCVGCGSCLQVCPAAAIVLKNKRAKINNSRCIGCASCIAACPEEAIDVNWGSGAGHIQEKMVEYAQAVLQDKQGKMLFLNFAVKITKECDCLAKDDPRIAPDLGILASGNPVGIDRACFDLVRQACGRDIFRQVHPEVEADKQLRYAASIGVGNLDYQLIEVE